MKALASMRDLAPIEQIKAQWWMLGFPLLVRFGIQYRLGFFDGADVVFPRGHYLPLVSGGSGSCCQWVAPLMPIQVISLHIARIG